MTNEELIVACTLNPALVRERVVEWTAVTERAAAVERHEAGVRLRFPRSADGGDDRALLSQLAAVAAAEHDCCPFFSFAISLNAGGVSLDISAPPTARPLVDVLLGLPANPRRGGR